MGKIPKSKNKKLQQLLIWPDLSSSHFQSLAFDIRIPFVKLSKFHSAQIVAVLSFMQYRVCVVKKNQQNQHDNNQQQKKKIFLRNFYSSFLFSSSSIFKKKFFFLFFFFFNVFFCVIHAHSAVLEVVENFSREGVLSNSIDIANIVKSPLHRIADLLYY